MVWEVRFFVEGQKTGKAPRERACPFGAEPDALTHPRFLLHRAP